jgi:hypothetical protein
MSAPALVLRTGLHTRAEEEQYLEALNVCFPGWGDRRMFDWCFSRTVAGLKPDLLQLVSDVGVIAGSAVTYRRVRLPGHTAVIAGMMTGSWTLPAARGGGAFTTLIEASVDAASAHGSALLLAFVTATNPSRRRLEGAGAHLLPTFYCCSSAARGDANILLEELPDETNLADAQFTEAAGARFVYTREEWTGQFRDRPNEVRVVGRPGNWIALVERVAGFDRVLAIQADGAWWMPAIDALTARAARADRQLFIFTASPREAAVLGARGFMVTNGFLAVLPGHDYVRGIPDEWTCQNGDRM